MKIKLLRSRVLIVMLPLLFLGSIIALTSPINKNNVQKFVKLTSAERAYLHFFLHRILIDDDFSYVLFGNKPLAFASYAKNRDINIAYDGISASSFKTKQGLEVFRKCQPFFLSRKIIVRFYENDDDLIVIMVNRRNFSKVFEQHKSDFQEILGSSITKESLLTQISENEDFGDLIQNHEALLGILLGYGRDNSWLFYKRREMLCHSRKFDISLRQRSLREQELALMDQQMKPFDSQSFEPKSVLNRVSIPLPSFMAIPNSSETKELLEKYKKDREKIEEIFTKQNIVDATLEKLLSG